MTDIQQAVAFYDIIIKTVLFVCVAGGCFALVDLLNIGNIRNQASEIDD